MFYVSKYISPIILTLSLVGCQSIASTGTSTHTSQTKKTVQLSASENKLNWEKRIASIREQRQERVIEMRERRLALIEKRKLADKERSERMQERRKLAKQKLALRKKTTSSENKAQKKINTAFVKAKDSRDDSLRVGWVKIDGKFVYRTAKIIKAEQEAAAAAEKKRVAAAAAAKRRVSTKSKRRTATPKGNYNKLIAKYAAQNGVPYRLARAVVFVESSFRANATGGVGEIGLMQIRLSTARGMGYKGSAKQLYNPATNLYWGMKYLGKAHRLAGGSTCGTILKYNAGHGAKRMNPVSRKYCNRVSRII